ncbi:hypothetical protein K1T71_001163 [Dendrolimus kikuchii]|uniref:Uncharacterized protein n=1 Tax=Dendrolimus kikuchii TaxID=765133 RepID=A0ACC1DIE3_9NEOP|nr:hypothetical protein K1T71_001163 [Dendrolimus kikuchii]
MPSLMKWVIDELCAALLLGGFMWELRAADDAARQSTRERRVGGGSTRPTAALAHSGLIGSLGSRSSASSWAKPLELNVMTTTNLAFE